MEIPLPRVRYRWEVKHEKEKKPLIYYQALFATLQIYTENATLFDPRTSNISNDSNKRSKLDCD